MSTNITTDGIATSTSNDAAVRSGGPTIKEVESALKESVTTTDITPGGIMPEVIFDDFYTGFRQATPLLDAISVARVPEVKGRYPILDITDRVRRPYGEGQSVERTTVGNRMVQIDCEEAATGMNLPQQVIDLNPQKEEIVDIALNMLEEQYAADTEEIGIRADSDAVGTADDPYFNQNDGWIALARDGDANNPPFPYVDASEDTTDDATANPTPQPLSTDLFHEVRLTLDNRFRERQNPVFMMSSDQLSHYMYQLSGVESDAAYMFLSGDESLNPFGFDTMATPHMPDDTMLFTDPTNLVYAVYGEMELNVLQNSDEIQDKRLHSKYALYSWDDFQFRDYEAGVYVDNIEPPVA